MKAPLSRWTGAFSLSLALSFGSGADLPNPTLISRGGGVSRTGSGDSLAAVVSGDGERIAFTSTAPDLVAHDANGAVSDVFVRDRAGGITVLVSVNTNGVSGNGPSVQPALSQEGRWIVFVSRASDLVPGDTNGRADVFLRDLDAGTTRLITRAVDGGPADGDSEFPQITPNGRWLGFESRAGNLVGGDTNGLWDVFVDDLDTGERYWISAPSDDPAIARLAPGRARDLLLSDDGESAVWIGEGANLAPPLERGTTVLTNRLFYRRPLSGPARMVDVFPTEVMASTRLDPWSAQLSAEGRHLAFLAYSSRAGAVPSGYYHVDLEAGVANGLTPNLPIYPRLREAALLGPWLTADGQSVVLESRTGEGGPGISAPLIAVWSAATGLSEVVFRGDDLGPPEELKNTVGRLLGVSRDGDFVAVLARHPAETADKGNPRVWQQLLILHRPTGEIRRISRRTDGTPTDANSLPLLSFSADGRRVAFQSDDDAMVTDDRNHAWDVLAYDWDSDAVELVSVREASLPSSTAFGWSLARRGALSADGQRLVMVSAVDGWAGTDTNRSSDVFLWDAGAERIEAVSVDAAGTATGNAGSGDAVLSADGRWAAFISSASDLVEGEGNQDREVFLRDLQGGRNFLVSHWGNEQPISGSRVEAPAISRDGRYVAYLRLRVRLPGPPSTVGDHLFLYDRTSREVVLISTNALGSAATQSGDSAAPVFSPAGDWLVFESRAWNLVPETPGPGRWVYGYHLPTGTYRLLSPIDAQPGEPVPRPDPVSFSPDGRYLVFAQVTGLSPGLYLHDFAEDQTTLLATNAFEGALSLGAEWIVYRTGAESSDVAPQVWVQDRVRGTRELVSVAVSGTEGDGPSGQAQVTPDGRFVVFISRASNLVPEQSLAVGELYLRDLQRGTTLRLSAAGGSLVDSETSSRPILSQDGRTLVYTSSVGGADTGDFNRQADVFLVRLPSEESGFRVTRITRASDGAVTLIWAASEGKTYQVEATGSLPGGWVTTPLEVVVAGGQAMAVDIGGTALLRRFYRVVEGP